MPEDNGLLHRDIDIAKVLLGQLANGALLLHLGDGVVELFQRRGVIFTQAEGDPFAQDFIVLYRIANKREAFTIRMRQETALPGREP